MKANGAPRILVVGGILRMQAALAVTLRKHFVVTTTSTASEGLHRLTGSRPDLVILDSCLPDLKSATFLRALRAHRPNCRVIILAEGEENDALRELLDLRVDGIFPRSDHLDVLLRRINGLLRKRRAGARQPARQGLDRHVGEVIRHMAASSANGLTVQGIARAVGLSSAQLPYLFRREIGMSVKEYATRVRVEIIKRLLAETDDKLDIIAEQLGFCDAPHLSRVFRRICGCPPGEYRRQSV
ncbi:MAG: helix-turn-helix domain-containing protein [Betaproteobacteria bacterium]|nr:MAG: helix-turn-helix domain-containing protein [Betaproteobacteria bacterium]